MTKGLGHQAYTILEVMIFLTVSSALMASAFYLINGQQKRAEYAQAVNDVRQQIDDVINNVAAGHYPSLNNFICRDTGTGVPVISTGSRSQGTNKGCIFVGRAMQFGVDSNPRNFNLYNLAGLQYKDVDKFILATDPVDVHPIALSNSAANPLPIDTTLNRTLQFGLQARTMHYTVGGVVHNTSTVAFMPSFGQKNTAGDLAGSQRVNLYAVADTYTEITVPVKASREAAISGIFNGIGTGLIPVDEVSICFDSSVNNKITTIVIGGNNRQLNTVVINSAGVCT